MWSILRLVPTLFNFPFPDIQRDKQPHDEKANTPQDVMHLYFAVNHMLMTGAKCFNICSSIIPDKRSFREKFILIF